MHSVVNCVEHVKMGGEVHVVGPVRLWITRMVIGGHEDHDGHYAHEDHDGRGGHDADCHADC